MSALDELVAVMARLRGPGGCPWDGEQTHASLAPYVIEEAHELVEAIEAGDDEHLREELGDVLLQVVFHADIARAEGRFDLDDVARTLTEKLRRRHPHVFADVAVDGIGDVVANWDAIKRAEKPERGSALDGIPASLPALARAQKSIRRAGRAGLALPVETTDASAPETEEELGRALLALARGAAERGLDAERALRTATRELEQRLRAAEAAEGSGDVAR
ncbi:MazG family protein [Agrococcus sp. Marseille-Q4369]|uniref:nucleoside triphosphate pyrophosphohydrolase n=1 Tax=Agrococcus sp. Marseille-Q4369 TaxID=2810513 RepID=UPI001B8AE117|nr:MazG family protein [Agrococcus sp. Marseille-Q4369]QUW18607.1 MazG family protein [Agrococcus sp. Marseille-Q4369]